MATFLTTSKMSPELAARVEASVSGRKRSPTPSRLSPRLVAGTRVIIALVILGVVVVVSSSWQRRASEEEQLRLALLTDVERESQSLAPHEHQLVSRAHALLQEAAKPMGDEVLPSEAALVQVLAAQSVYVRGPVEAFDTRAAEATRESVKDTFVLCLVEPPAQRTEKALLARVQVAYTGGLEERTANVHRLHTAALALPLLTRAWMQEVEQASHVELAKLRTAFNRAPMDRAKAAAKATHLIYLLDEPAAPDARIELDGASAHAIRVGIVEIATGKPVLRVRRNVDPAWISNDNRLQLGKSLNACRLAFDLRAELSPTHAKAAPSTH